MRTQMLIRLQASTEKGHSKAMKIAAETKGVESVTLAGKDRSLLLVIGDGVDCNDLTTKLRKKVGHADVVELRTLHDKAGGGYYYGNRASPDYGNSYGYTPVSSYGYSPAQEYYNGYRPAYENYNYNPPPPPPYGATVVHHEYYPVDDQNGCSIM
ncbi:hypothetical protein QOZ80_2AG0135490 [Eleusine coracana subsp. coracana]|nr:hypothetical protein QOZ80_2AG0135490 [Eleusine coracana subsp. coracana]